MRSGTSSLSCLTLLIICCSIIKEIRWACVEAKQKQLRRGNSSSDLLRIKLPQTSLVFNPAVLIHRFLCLCSIRCCFRITSLSFTSFCLWFSCFFVVWCFWPRRSRNMNWFEALLSFFEKDRLLERNQISKKAVYFILKRLCSKQLKHFWTPNSSNKKKMSNFCFILHY